MGTNTDRAKRAWRAGHGRLLVVGAAVGAGVGVLVGSMGLGIAVGAAAGAVVEMRRKKSRS